MRKGRKGVMRGLGRNVRVIRDMRMCEKSLCETGSRCPLCYPCIYLYLVKPSKNALSAKAASKN